VGRAGLQRPLGRVAAAPTERYGIRYVEREFGRTPGVAWLPDSFGFREHAADAARGTPALRAFGTTKLGWNDTTVVSLRAFSLGRSRRQLGLAAPTSRRSKAASNRRVANAKAARRFAADRARRRRRRAPDDALAARSAASGNGRRSARGFATSRDAALPEICDELYLQEHRGTATTHHDVKARNAALERSLGAAELSSRGPARCTHHPFFLDEARRAARRTPGRSSCARSFTTCCPGRRSPPSTSTRTASTTKPKRSSRASHGNARSVLPVAGFAARGPSRSCRAGARRRTSSRTNALIARVGRDGTLARAADAAAAENLVRSAHRLALYAIVRSAGMRGTSIAAIAAAAARSRDRLGALGRCARGALRVRRRRSPSRVFRSTRRAVPARRDGPSIGASSTRCCAIENELAFARPARALRFAARRGRSRPDPRTRAERAKFEACGQRLRDSTAPIAAASRCSRSTRTAGAWERGSARLELGHSLLRGPTWPDPGADRGDARILVRLRFRLTRSAWANSKRSGSALPARAGCRCSRATIRRCSSSRQARRRYGTAIVVRVRECDGARARGASFAAARGRVRRVRRCARAPSRATCGWSTGDPRAVRAFRAALVLVRTGVIEAVLFDLDDTLHDDTRTYRARGGTRRKRRRGRTRRRCARAIRSLRREAEAFWQNLSPAAFDVPLVGLRARMWATALRSSRHRR
jgi:hypothetical protein